MSLNKYNESGKIRSVASLTWAEYEAALEQHALFTAATWTNCTPSEWIRAVEESRLIVEKTMAEIDAYRVEASLTLRVNS